MTTDLSQNLDGTVTLYVNGKKVMRANLAEVVKHLTGKDAPAPAAKKPKREKPKSRSARWSEAAQKALDALNDLKSIQEEFEEWRDNLPENLKYGSAIGDKLDTVCDMDIQSAIDTAEEADSADLPLGFGRD